MIYKMTPLSQRLSVDGIYSVLRVDYMQRNGIGEAHGFPELTYIARGTAYGILDGREKKRNEGQLLLIAPGVFHKKKSPTVGEGWIIGFSSDSPLLSQLYNRPIDLDGDEKKELAEVFSLGLRCFTGAAAVGYEGGTQLSIDADPYILEGFKKRLELFLLGLHERHRAAVTEADLNKEAEVKRILSLLLAHLHESLSVEEAARLAGISVSGLKAVFREKGGVLHAFTRMKIERAKQLIQEREMNFSEIAQALGFASLHYFSRTFKGVTGISPSQYRQLI